MNNAKNYTVTGLSWSASSSGMMCGSDTYHSEELYTENGTVYLRVTDRPAFEAQTVRVYRVPADAVEQLRQLTALWDLYALNKLKEKQRPMMLDYSSSSGITVMLEVTQPDGSVRKDSLMLNTSALYDNGFGEISKALFDFAKPFAAEENLATETVQKRKNGSIDPFGSGTQTLRSFASNLFKGEAWFCPECGNKNESGKFCAECGCRKP